MFAIFGMEHYRAVLALQVVVDVGTCFLIADMARRLISPRAARAAFLMSALCPFLASYAAAALTETLEIFFTVLAFDCAVAGLEALDQGRLRPWVGCGLATAAAILLRPDGGLILIAIELYLGVLLVIAWKRQDAGESPAATCSPGFSTSAAGWVDSGSGLPGAAGSLGLAQSAYPASLSTPGAALCQ